MRENPRDLADDERATVLLASGLPAVMDGWLGDTHARALRLEILGLLGAGIPGPFRAAGIGAFEGHHLAPSIRSDRVCWFDAQGVAGLCPGVEVALFLARLGGLMEHLNGTCFLGLERVECHASCFEAGAFYGAHIDTLQDDDRRVVSFCYYLNDTWTLAAGGCLRMSTDPAVDVAPLLDRLVLFRSAELRHEVLPTAERRLSLTGWLSRARAASH